MPGLGRFLFLVHIPVTLMLLLWVWVGRSFFGVGGWFFLFIPLVAGPFIALALLVVEVLTLTTGIRPAAFTTSQTASHVVLWAALFGVGFFLVDVGDAPDSGDSIMTELLVRSDTTLEVSSHLFLGCVVVAVLAWVGCVVTAIAARRHRDGFRGVR